MTGVYDVKITVIKCMSTKELFGDNLPVGIIDKVQGVPKEIEHLPDVCHKVHEGQEFIVNGLNGDCPGGMCGWAFADIQRDITFLRFGGSDPWVEEGKMLSCCTDGFRPVFFKLEAVRREEDR